MSEIGYQVDLSIFDDRVNPEHVSVFDQLDDWLMSNRDLAYDWLHADHKWMGVHVAHGCRLSRIANDRGACRDFLGAECLFYFCLLYTSPSPRDATLSRMPSSA